VNVNDMRGARAVESVAILVLGRGAVVSVAVLGQCGQSPDAVLGACSASASAAAACATRPPDAILVAVAAAPARSGRRVMGSSVVLLLDREHVEGVADDQRRRHVLPRDVAQGGRVPNREEETIPACNQNQRGTQRGAQRPSFGCTCARDEETVQVGATRVCQ